MAEFLPQRPRDPQVDLQGGAPSCARTDAKPINRDLQMKYDIAKNEDGPLRSTLRTDQNPSTTTNDSTPPDHESILESRFRDIEDHMAVRYGTL
jgi:hypothetical protein